MTVSLPRPLVILGALRASGRFVWPLYYLIVLASVAVLVTRLRPRRAALLLGTLAALQVMDTSAGWRVTRARLEVPPGSTFDSPLQSPFWSDAARTYGTVRVVPWDPQQWHVFAIYAQAHRLQTDSAYVARADRTADVEQRQIDQLIALRFETGSFYVLNDELAARVSGRLDPALDFLGRVDGFWVLAPRWHRLRPGAGGQAPPGDPWSAAPLPATP